MTARERAAYRSLQLYVDRAGDEMTQALVLDFENYRDFIGCMGHAAIQFGRRRRRFSLIPE